MKKLIIQLIKFGIVGVIATIIDFGVLMLLREIFSVDVLVATAAGFLVSVIANYILSMMFVFESSGKGWLCEFFAFVLFSAGGLLINEIIMWLGTEYFAVHYMLPKICATVIVTIYNFITRKIFLEKK